MKKPPKESKDKRNLSPAEQTIWHRVARTVKPYGPETKPAPPPFSDKDLQLAPGKMRPGFEGGKNPLIGSKKPDVIKGKPDPQIRQDKRVRRGKVEIDMTIDLHDFTQISARDVLVGRLMQLYNRGGRCALVITGKGSISGGGVLKRSFPRWMADPDIRAIIADYAPAHNRHGGGGAWYVFLKAPIK